MNTLKIIEGIDKSFHSHKFERLQLGEGKYIESEEVLNWHKQSIIQILESEIDRKRGKIVTAMAGIALDDDEEGWNLALEEDIAHLTVLLDSLK